MIVLGMLIFSEFLVIPYFGFDQNLLNALKEKEEDKLLELKEDDNNKGNKDSNEV